MKLVVPTKKRVIEPDVQVVHVKGYDDYATMCGLTNDSHANTGKNIIYGTRKKVSCKACINAILHALQFLSVADEQPATSEDNK